MKGDFVRLEVRISYEGCDFLRLRTIINGSEDRFQ